MGLFLAKISLSLSLSLSLYLYLYFSMIVPERLSFPVQSCKPFRNQRVRGADFLSTKTGEMTSVEEEELVRMVRDYIESDSTSPPSLKSSTHHQPPCFTLQDLLLRASDHEIEVLEKVLSYVREMGTAMSMTPAAKIKRWIVIRLKVDGFEASLCQSPCSTTSGHPKGWYEYVEVTVKDRVSQNPKRLIVDMDFKSQFELARPTESYRKLTEALPSIFVGSEEKLEGIISFLCSAAKESMRERGLHVPPWRRQSYMQSKWLSKDCKRVVVSLTPKTDMAMQ